MKVLFMLASSHPWCVLIAPPHPAQFSGILILDQTSAPTYALSLLADCWLRRWLQRGVSSLSIHSRYPPTWNREQNKVSSEARRGGERWLVNPINITATIWNKKVQLGGGVSFFLPSIAFAVRLLMSTWESRNPNCRGMISDPHTDCRRVLKDHRWVSQQILQASEKRDVQIPEGVRCVPLFLSALTWVRGHSMFLFELGCVECPKRRSLAMPPIPRSNKQIPCPDRRYPSLILRPSSNSPSFHVQDKPIFIAQTYFFLVCRFIFLKQKRGCTSLCCWCEILHDMISSSFYWTHGSFFLVRLIGFFLLGGRCSLY